MQNNTDNGAHSFTEAAQYNEVSVTSKKLNAETILVEPINKEKLAAYFEKFIPKDDNQSFIIDTDSVFIHPYKSFLIDNDCCAGNLDRKFNRNTKSTEWTVNLGIRKSTKTEGGESYPMYNESYFEIYESELRENGLLDPAIPLKDFMLGRFNYNPRIERNTAIMIKEINKVLKEFEAINN